jgi:DNA modification methylase
MSLLLHGDCLEHLHGVDDDSVDLIFCDLPYATKTYSAVACKWNTPIDLDKLWEHFMRIKKLNTPLFFTCNTKFGVDLIQAAPKKCFFRYDLIWVKSAPTGFLCSGKMPLRAHEMVYVFYEKLPFYDISSHKHKFKQEYNDYDNKDGAYGIIKSQKGHPEPLYEPALPTSIVKEPEPEPEMVKDFTPNKNGNIYDCPDNQEFAGRNGKPRYEPPLPTSVVKEDVYGQTTDMKNNYEENFGMDKKERKEVRYDPPLPTSVVKEETGGATGEERKVNPKNSNKGGLYTNIERLEDVKYDPPLPTSMLEIKSTRGKHSTEKPVALMEWILKYYSKEGDVVLDPTMGSGSTGVACANMNRNFIGIEMDAEIYEVAVNRIEK